MSDQLRCEWFTSGVRCFRAPTVTMSILTGAGVRGERSLCSHHARRYARIMADRLAAGVALLSYDFSRHREVS